MVPGHGNACFSRTPAAFLALDELGRVRTGHVWLVIRHLRVYGSSGGLMSRRSVPPFSCVRSADCLVCRPSV